MNEVPAALGWVDWALLAVLALSVVIGLWRGLVFEVLSLLGWVAAYIAAQMFAPAVAPLLPIGHPGEALNHAAAFAATFVAVPEPTAAVILVAGAIIFGLRRKS